MKGINLQEFKNQNRIKVLTTLEMINKFEKN